MFKMMEKMEMKQEKKMENDLEVKKKVSSFESQFKKDIEAKVKIIEDYENTLKRLQADFENYIKRVQKEKEDYAKLAVAKVLVKFVDIVDDLDRALNVLEKTKDGEIKTGIKMVHSRFHRILTDEGIKSFSSKGNKFDPYIHEVIEMVSSEEPDGIVVEEIQKGYFMNDDVLRTAKVKVSKGGKS